MILHSWQAQFRIKSGILGLTVEIPLWPPCFYHFFGSCFGGHDEASLLAFEALRGSPRPARGQALDAKRTVEVPLCGHVCQFLNFISGAWWNSFWLQEIHPLSNVPAWAASNIELHQHKTTFKRYTKKPSPMKPTPLLHDRIGKK